MNDVVWVALFSAAGAAAVAIASAAATIFGPAWRERVQRKDDRIAATESARFDRALEFAEALHGLASLGTATAMERAGVARQRFISTLRPGERAAEYYCTQLITYASTQGQAAIEDGRLGESIDKLFRWLRGEQKDFK